MYKGFDQLIAYVAVCYQFGVVLVPKVMFGAISWELCWQWWRLPSHGNPFSSVQLPREGSPEKDIHTNESNDEDDGEDAHGEEEIGPAWVEVNRQLDQWSRVSWEIKIIIMVNKTITFKSEKDNNETSASFHTVLSFFFERPHILKQYTSSGKTKSRKLCRYSIMENKHEGVTHKLKYQQNPHHCSPMDSLR